MLKRLFSSVRILLFAKQKQNPIFEFCVPIKNTPNTLRSGTILKYSKEYFTKTNTQSET